MDWITDKIAIGNYLDAENADLRSEYSIRSMICLSGKLRGVSADALGLDALDNYDLKDSPATTPRSLEEPSIQSRGLKSLSQTFGAVPRWSEPLSNSCRRTSDAFLCLEC